MAKTGLGLFTRNCTDINRNNTAMRRLLFAAAIVATLNIKAEIKPATILQSGMVVEYSKPLTLWGTADPGEKFDIKINNSRKARVVADQDGNWKVQLKPLASGGPYEIRIGDKTLKNVLSGDVVLCSGQSNMELYVYRVDDMFHDLISTYQNDNIRQFIAPKEMSFDGPRQDLDGGEWISTSPSRSRNFSALGYFLAMEMNARTGRPVGIINCSWGGTPIESWMSERSLSGFQRQLAQLDIDRDNGYRERVTAMEREKQGRWNAALWAGDPGRKEHWESGNTDISSWQTIDLLKERSWTTDGCNPIAGSHWFAKKINVPAELASKPAILRMGVIVDSDSTYVNGEFVGTVSYCYPPRIYKLREGLLKPGENTVTVRLVSNGGYGEFITEKPYKLVFEGGEELSIEGNWQYMPGKAMPKAPGSTFWCYSPTVLYNSMISPITNYGVGNVVWYQGESNVSTRNEYGRLLERMVDLWRSDRKDQTLPFYVVELANFLPESDMEGRKAWAEMREIQRKACDKIGNCSIVDNYDLGEWNDIHPLDKKTLAMRIVDKMNIKVRKKSKK